MSEMSASTNVEAGSAASNSGTGSSAEAGMSGPAEAGDQAGAGSAANDNIPQAANDNAAQDSNDLARQTEPARDASTEATGDLTASYAPEAGEGGPADAGEEVPGSSPQEVPEPANEVAEPVSEVPDPVNEAAEPAQVEQPQSPDEVTNPPGPEVPQQANTEAPQQGSLEVPQQTGQEVPANDTVPRVDASQVTMADTHDLEPGDLKDEFNKAAGKEGEEEKGEDGHGDGKEVPADDTASRADASQIKEGIGDMKSGTLTPKFNAAAGKKGTGRPEAPPTVTGPEPDSWTSKKGPRL